MIFLHHFYEFLLETAFFTLAHILVLQSACVDYLFRLIYRYSMHFRPNLWLSSLNKFPYISNVELLNVHLRINGNNILLKLVDMPSNIDLPLLFIFGLDYQENCRDQTIFSFLVCIHIRCHQVNSVPGSFIDSTFFQLS